MSSYSCPGQSPTPRSREIEEPAHAPQVSRPHRPRAGAQRSEPAWLRARAPVRPDAAATRCGGGVAPGVRSPRRYRPRIRRAARTFSPSGRAAPSSPAGPPPLRHAIEFGIRRAVRGFGLRSRPGATARLGSAVRSLTETSVEVHAGRVGPDQAASHRLFRRRAGSRSRQPLAPAARHGRARRPVSSGRGTFRRGRGAGGRAVPPAGAGACGRITRNSLPPVGRRS